MNTIYTFNKTQELVEKLLSNEERCRNDDKWLCYRVTSHFTRIYIPFQDFKKFPSFETVTRCRRKVQNTNKQYPPTDPKTIEHRRTRQGKIKAWSFQ